VKPVDFHPAAKAELDAAAAYYEGLRPGLGFDFQAEVAAAVGQIQANPQLFAVGKGKGCEGPVRRFPYSVFYRELPTRIWIAAVAHQKRKPGYWGPTQTLMPRPIASAARYSALAAGGFGGCWCDASYFCHVCTKLLSSTGAWAALKNTRAETAALG